MFRSQRLTSTATLLFTVAAPVLWWLFLLVVASRAIAGRRDVPILAFELGGLAMVGLLWRHLVHLSWVSLTATGVRARLRRKRAEIPFADIRHVVDELGGDTARTITLVLERPCALGDKVVFIPALHFLLRDRHPVAVLLRDRIAAARAA